MHDHYLYHTIKVMEAPFQDENKWFYNDVVISGECTSFTLRLATKARSRSLGPLHPSFNLVKILRDALNLVLPDNAHEIASGKLFISLTRVSDRQPVLVSQYDSKEELIQVRLIIIEFIIITGILVAIYYDESRRYFWIF